MESCPSWPKEHDWKSCKRVITCFKGSNPLLSVCESYKYDPLVKWLRHRPFTAVTWVQIPYGSWNASLAQLVEQRYRKPWVTGSTPATGM